MSEVTFSQQVDKDAAQKTAEDILSKSEYQPIDVEPLPDFGTPSGGGVGIGVGLIQIVLIVAIVAVLAFFIWYFRDALFARNTKKKKKKKNSVSLEEAEKQYTKRDVWLERAEQAEREKKYDQAVHCRYMALVAGLAEKDQVPLSDSLTCGEYSEMLPEKIAASEFTAVRSTFENSRYGGITAIADDTHSLQSLDTAILATVDTIDQPIAGSGQVGQ